MARLTAHMLMGEDACTHCPMNLVCLTGAVIDGNQTNYAARTSMGDYPLNYPLICSRCWTVTFALDEDYYVCGLLRYGRHARAAHTPAAADYIQAALGLSSWRGLQLVGPPGGCATAYNRRIEEPWEVDHPLNYVHIPENGDLTRNGKRHQALRETMDALGYNADQGSRHHPEMSTDDCATFMRRDPRFEIEEH